MASEELLQLQEENEYLDLKIKYIQSVATIFRQKVGLLLRELIQGRSDGAALADALEGMMGEMDVAEDPTTKSRAELKKPSLAVDGADYWRDQFLSVMKDTKPSSLQDAQSLCDILQEKNAIAVREAALRKEYRMLEQRYNSTKASLKEVLESKAITAEEALQELYRQKLRDLEDSSTVESIAAKQEELVLLKEENVRLQTQNKILRVRCAESKKALHEFQVADSGVEAYQKRFEELTKEMKSLRVALASKDADVRRYEADVLHLQRDVALREQGTIRANGKISALEAEATFALKDGVADTDTQEIAYLRRHVDTFELHVRKLEHQLASLCSERDELQQTVSAQSLEIKALSTEIEARRRAHQTLEKINAEAQLDKAQRTAHRTAQEEFEMRMGTALKEVSEVHNIRSLVAQLQGIRSDLDKLDLHRQQSEQFERQLNEARRVVTAITAELNRCQKFSAFPDVHGLASTIVDAGIPGARAPLLREVELRREGDWREVRDTISGSVIYIKSSPTGTPFEPKPIRPRSDEKPVDTPPPSSPPAVSAVSPPPVASPPPKPETEKADTFTSPAAGEAEHIDDTAGDRDTASPNSPNTIPDDILDEL